MDSLHSPLPHALLRFSDFELDLSNRELRQHGEAVPIRPKAWSVLAYLVSNHGQLFAAADIVAKVWGHEHVSTTAVRVCIREIRNALDDNAKSPLYIRTVGRQGYCFIAEVKLAHLSTGSNLLVGRTKELQKLAILATQTKDGRGAMALVTAEPGGGKTTLVQLFLEQVSSSEEWLLAEGNCVALYGAGEAYQPVLDALQTLFLSEPYNAFESLLLRYAPHWAMLMPLKLDEVQSKALSSRIAISSADTMLREVLLLLERLSQIKPLTLVIEDLQWSDTATLELLTSLSRRAHRSRLLVVITSRIGDTKQSSTQYARIFGDLLQAPGCKKLHLPSLTLEHVQHYIAARFPPIERSDQFSRLAKLVFEKCEGNPLFLVNTCNFLVSTGLIWRDDKGWRFQHPEQKFIDIDVQIPNDLRRLIEHQFKQLHASQQGLLRLASVSGKQFCAASVAELEDRPLEDIEKELEELSIACSFLQAAGVTNWPNRVISSSYSFTHSLYQNIAYAQIAPARKLNLHKTMGRLLEQAFLPNAERKREVAAQMATHFQASGDAFTAVKYFHEAAINAQDRNASSQALDYLERALSLLAEQADDATRRATEAELLLSYGPLVMAVSGYASAAAKKIYQRALVLCKDQDLEPLLFLAYRGMWQFHHGFGEMDTARKIAADLFDIAQSSDDSKLKLAGYEVMASTHLWYNETDAAIRYARNGLEIYQPEEHQALAFQFAGDPGASCMGVELVALTALGYSLTARTRYEKLTQLIEQLDDAMSTAKVMSHIGVYHQFSGHIEELGQHASKMIALADLHGFLFLRVAGGIYQGWVQAQIGEHTQGLQHLLTALDAGVATQAKNYWPYYFGMAAEAHLFAHQQERGLALIEQAFEHGNTLNYNSYDGDLYRIRAELLLLTKGPAKARREAEAMAEQALQTAITMASKIDAHIHTLRAAMILARLWVDQDRINEALNMFEPYLNKVLERQDNPHMLEAEELLRKLQRWAL